MSKMFYTNSKQYRRYTTKYNKNIIVAAFEKKPVLFIIAVLALSILILSIGTISTNVSAGKVPLREKTVVSIQIEEGETLWSIASRYITEEYKDINTYINEIKKTNGLYEDTIHEGAYIVIPYYTSTEVASNSW